MATDSAEHKAALASATQSARYGEALVRKVRRALLASRISLVVAGLVIGMLVVSIVLYKPANLGVKQETTPEQLRAEALINIGAFVTLAAMAILALLCIAVGLRYARRWARAASETIATSELENRKLLQRMRSSGTHFALFLRGFEEEGKSSQNLFALPITTRRPDRATRWIEAEIIDQLERRGKITFCIANPSDTFMLPGAVRFRASPERWQSEVFDLAKESETIVFYLSSASQGLQTELDLLQRENLQPRTIVVASRRMQAQHSVLIEGFPVVIAPPSLSPLNQSAFGPMVGRARFQRALSAGIDRLTRQPE